MAWTENMTQEQYETDIKEISAKAKEGLFNKEDFDKALQSEGDKIRTKYVQEKKLLEDELVKYKPKDKSEAEIELEKRQSELTKKEKEIADKERLFKVQGALQANNLPSSLSKYLNGEDTDAMVKDVTEILNSHLLNGSFKPSKHKTSENITVEDFKKMNYQQKCEFSSKNPELYEKFRKQI